MSCCLGRAPFDFWKHLDIGSWFVFVEVIKFDNDPGLVARRCELYFRVAKKYFKNKRSEWVKFCFCHSKIKFISSSRRVMFFLLYGQKDIDKIIEGN